MAQLHYIFEKIEKPKTIQSRQKLIKYTYMNILKISNGKVELREESGTIIRTIVSSNAVAADLNAKQDKVLITYSNGKVELRKESGTIIRTIVSAKAKNARFQGEDIAVTLDNGKVQLMKESGTIIRTI